MRVPWMSQAKRPMASKGPGILVILIRRPGDPLLAIVAMKAGGLWHI